MILYSWVNDTGTLLYMSNGDDKVIITHSKPYNFWLVSVTSYNRYRLDVFSSEQEAIDWLTE